LSFVSLEYNFILKLPLDRKMSNTDGFSVTKDYIVNYKVVAKGFGNSRQSTYMILSFNCSSNQVIKE